MRELAVPSQHVGLVVGKGGANLDRMRRLYGGVDTRVGDFDEPGAAPPQRRLAFTGRAPDVDKAMAGSRAHAPARRRGDAGPPRAPNSGSTHRAACGRRPPSAAAPPARRTVGEPPRRAARRPRP